MMLRTPRVIIYKQVNAFKNAKGKVETRYVGEIDTRNGAPRKFYGADPELLGKLLKSNLSSMNITTYNLSSDPKDRNGRLRESIHPGAEVKRLDRNEAGKVFAALKSD